MTRSFFRPRLAAFALAISAVAAPAFAADKTVALTAIVEHPALDAARDGVKDELKAAGFETGKNLKFEYQSAQGNTGTAAQIARKYVGEKPDVIVAIATPSAQAVVAATKDIPVVYSAVTDPVAARLVKTWDASGTNVTGVSDLSPLAKHLELIKKVVPNAKRVGVIYSPGEANSVAIVEDLRAEAVRRRVRVIEARFRADPAGRPIPDGIDEKVREIAAAGAQWLYLGPDSYLFTQIDRIAFAAAHERLPTFATTEALLEGSAPVLAGLISRYRAVGEFAAHKAEQILMGGRRARDVPVETLARFAFVVRVDVARGLDVLPPITLFNYAEFR